VERARVSRTGKLIDFTTLTSRALGAVQSTLGVGGCGNICFGYVLLVVRQGQRRDAVATHTHTRTEGRGPVWGSQFTTEAVTLLGNSAKLVLMLN